MTNKEIEELEKKLNSIKRIKATITSAKSNLDSYERVFAGELKLQNHSDDSNPIYITGERKEEIKKILVKSQLEIIEKGNKELQDL